MVKRVDYSSRFEFLRQAAFALVLDVGVHALTLRALAADLGLGVNTVRRLVDPSVELATLAADEVRTRRRKGRWAQLPDDQLAAARVLALRLLPDDASRIDEEVVWLRLATFFGPTPNGPEARRQVRHDFQIAERGWSDRDVAGERHGDLDGSLDGDLDGDRDPDAYPLSDAALPVEQTVEQTVEPSSDVRPRGPAALAGHFADRRHEVDAIIDRVLTLLETPDREVETGRLRALVDGLSVAVCLGRITPEECVRTMDRHLTGLREPPVRLAE